MAKSEIQLQSGQPPHKGIPAAQTQAAQGVPTLPGASGVEKMNIVIVGHVDHGKSTLVGRLLADTGSLPEGRLEAVKEDCRRNAKPFEYAFLIDALKDEQSQGITIDAARVFFKSARRHYIIIDAPGHIEFLKNMVTGASRAEAALLVIDAQEGIQENSRRHGYLLSMLGIGKIVVVVNKMDLAGYSEQTFHAIQTEYRNFLTQLNVNPAGFIPVSGIGGDNVAGPSSNMDWYKGPTLLQALDGFDKAPPMIRWPFRMPVQDVYKFTQMGDDRRIIAGTAASGQIQVGEKVVFYPSGKTTRVKSLETFNTPPKTGTACGQPAGFTMEEQIYVQRGEIAARAGEPRPKVASRIRASVFWLGHKPLTPKKEYLLKLGTARVKARLEEVSRVIDASNLNADEGKDRVERHDVAEVVFSLGKALAFDLAADNRETSRFVVVDDYEIHGGGIILEDLPDSHTWVRESVINRNTQWVKSIISVEERAERYNQQPTLVLITGERGVGRRRVAKELEARLFATGKVVYYLGFGSVLHGMDADIEHNRSDATREEHIRRFAEIAHILLDAGVILVSTAVGLFPDDLEIIKTVVDSSRIETILVGENAMPGVSYDLQVPGGDQVEESVKAIRFLLQDHGVIFKA